MAQNEGHYSMNLKDQNIAIINVTNYFSNWFNIDDNSTFEKTKDDVDEIGMQHIVFQQYYKGTKVEHGVVFVHAQNNMVVSVNATIMELPFQSLAKQDSQLKSTPVDNAEQLIVPINSKKGVVYRSVYKTFDSTQNADVYTDVETGEVLKTTSHTFYGNAYTMYHGWQTMDCWYNSNEGYYYLIDQDRNIITLNASYAPYEGSVYKGRLSDVVSSYANNCDSYTSPFATWAGILSSVTITGDDGDWWYTAITDTRPDFYIKIYSSTGKLLYTSNVKDNTKSPVTFSNINVSIDEGSYIKIYDEDVTSDTYGGSVTISNPLSGSYTWSGSLTSGKIVIKSNPALDAHWGMQNVYDYYLETFNRKNFNNLEGTFIYQFIDPYAIYGSHVYNNASAGYDANGVGYMLYGLGDGEEMSEVVALDVMAHEFTHNVTAFNGNGGLEYLGESGALNESFSDIFGCAVEFYALGEDANWFIGEDVMINYTNLRDMADPKNSMDGLILKEDLKDAIIEYYGRDYYDQLEDTLQIPQPDTYKGDFWANTSDYSEYGDNGGVHQNSGVQNKWFYLLCEGGNGTNDNDDDYSVTGIGIEKAQKIAYRNLMYYLTPTASFWDSRNGSLNATKDLYGENSAEYKAVEDAWFAVGVGSISGNSDKFVVTAKAEDATIGSVMGSGLYELNEEATLIAIPENGYEFVKWNDGITTNPRKISVTKDTTYIATFKYVEGSATATISLFSNNNLWGTVTGAGTYEIGESVSISANPTEGYQFVQWNDGNTQQSRTIVVNGDITLIATFEKLVEIIPKKTISLYSNNNDWGILSGEGEYAVGSEVEIYALPREGYRFVQWNDGNTENPRYITISEDLMLIATFEKNPNTAINDITNELVISIQNNQILINGIAPTYVTNMLGQKIANQNLKTGCYYVQIGNTIQSIIIK